MLTANRRVSKQKATGAHFTPPELANLVARRVLAEVWFPTKTPLRVLDPSCGDGELLLAIRRCVGEGCRERLMLIGVEADKESLQNARRRLQPLTGVECALIHGDFLEMSEKDDAQPTLFPSPVPGRLPDHADIVIANPPYVRTQVLGSQQAQHLAIRFGLSGRIDLYQAFVIAMSRMVAPGGLLGVITSNRFLTIRSGLALRRFLAAEFDILEILDLGDTKLFEAAVLPAVFVGRKRASPASAAGQELRDARFVRVYECPSREEETERQPCPARSLYEVLESPQSGLYAVNGRTYSVAAGHLSLPAEPNAPWGLLTGDEEAWVRIIESKAWSRLSEIAKVRVGIKTTADSVFIRSDWDVLPEVARPESELLWPLLSHDEADRWQPTNGNRTRRRVLYTHQATRQGRSVIDLRRFPHAAAYLEGHRDQLAARTYIREAGREWYEIWVPQDPAAWKLPKVVFPDISPEPRFFYDPHGAIVDGNCYWLTLVGDLQEDLLFLIMAVANSQIMARYHDLRFQNRLYSGRRRYLAQYVEQYPIPDPSLEVSKRVISLSKGLAIKPVDANQRRLVEDEIERLVAGGFLIDLK